MKTIIIAALIVVSAVATGTVANADTFAVHGYQCNSYGN
jgi:hypothetical protein